MSLSFPHFVADVAFYLQLQAVCRELQKEFQGQNAVSKTPWPHRLEGHFQLDSYTRAGRSHQHSIGDSVASRNAVAAVREDRNERAFRVGSAQLQILAVQKEIGESLNLNGDILEDLLKDRGVSRPNYADRTLDVMFSSTQLPDVKSGEMLQRLLKLKKAHAFYNPEFRPPVFARKVPSMAPPTAPIHVVLKRKTDGKGEDEQPAKRQNVSKSAGDEPTTCSNVIWNDAVVLVEGDWTFEEHPVTRFNAINSLNACYFSDHELAG
ncbi:hypothetical protein B0H13DRAFT_1856266 [Mycena leptocephala]|nr:hypothetical protein B0H13DRAFT_1856266 [Mycena leptocephala]